MNIVVLNRQFETIYILDTYESLIWVDRYYEAGDFEIYTPMNYILLDYLKEGYYLQIEDSDRTMIIEKIQVTADIDDGQHLVITGRSLESILTRRVVFPEVIVEGKLQTIIKTLLTDTIINPTSSSIGDHYKLRKIDNFVFKDSTDTAVTKVTIPEETKNGEEIYEIIQGYCQDNELGFRVRLNESNQFVFELYAGTDRSADQTEHDLVLFAKQYDNISSSEFYRDSKDYKNFIIMLPGQEAEAVYYGSTTASGLDHREEYYTCQAETQEEMDYYGNLELLERSRDISVTAEVDPYNSQFVYNRDYFLGDIVQMASEINEGQARVVEYTINVTESGKQCYPTFEFIPVYDEEEG